MEKKMEASIILWFRLHRPRAKGLGLTRFKGLRLRV